MYFVYASYLMIDALNLELIKLYILITDSKYKKLPNLLVQVLSKIIQSDWSARATYQQIDIVQSNFMNHRYKQ